MLWFRHKNDLVRLRKKIVVWFKIKFEMGNKLVFLVLKSCFVTH